MTDPDDSRLKMTAGKGHPSSTHAGLWLVVAAIAVAGVLSLRPQTAHAQYEIFDRLGISDELSVGGSVGMVGELYGASGIPSRRPGASGRMFARAQASGYGLSYGLNMVLDTRQFQFNQTGRQSINQIDLSAQYEWLEVNVGTVSPRLSQYSLSDISVTGGHVRLTPGKWRFEYAGGVAQRAVEPDTSLDRSTAPVTGIAGPSPRTGRGQGAFRRWVHAARIGYGERGGTYVDLIGLYGADDTTSLSTPGPLAPVANTNVSAVSGTRLWDGRVQVEGQLTASGLVGDTRAPRADASPGFLYDFGVMQARVGSRMNYAGRLSTRLNLRERGQLRVSYERIQPGFRSVGVSHLRSDQEVIQLRPSVRLFEGTLRLSGQFSRRTNNLAGDLQSTLRRRRGRLNARVHLNRTFTVTTSVSRLVNETTAVPGAQDVATFRQVSHTLSLSPSLTVRDDGRTHSASLTAHLQRMNDQRSVVGGATGYNTYSSTLSYTLGLAGGTSVGLSGNAMVSRRQSSDLLTTTLNTNVSRSFFDRALRLNVTGGWSRNRVSTNRRMVANRRLSSAPLPMPSRENVTQQLSASSNVTYRLPMPGDLSLRVRALRSSRPTGGTFREVQSIIRYEHSF